MRDYKELLNEFTSDVIHIKAIHRGDIPEIDLYMDQITTFMDNKLVFYKRNNEDKILTKTMINNYAKAKLFPAPIKKKYSKNHIMLLILIYHLKAILTINDIDRLLHPITEELRENSESKILDIVYDGFIDIQENIETILSDPEKKYHLIENPKTQSLGKNEMIVKLILTVLLLSVQANTEKRLAEKILDEFF